MCFDRIKQELLMPSRHLHFPKAEVSDYETSWEGARCATMQGGQGDVKHWAFNDPVKRKGQYEHQPPTPEEYLRLGARVVDLHPMTIMQDGRTSGGGQLDLGPTQ